MGGEGRGGLDQCPAYAHPPGALPVEHRLLPRPAGGRKISEGPAHPPWPPRPQVTRSAGDFPTLAGWADDTDQPGRSRHSQPISSGGAIP